MAPPNSDPSAATLPISWTEWYNVESTGDIHRHRFRSSLVPVPEDATILVAAPDSRKRAETADAAPTTGKPSNESLLGLAFVTFFSFTVAQGVVAIFFAHSKAMMGDCCAMLVDAGTYLLNYAAERGKGIDDSQRRSAEGGYDDIAGDDFRIQRIQRRRSLLLLELIPPLCSLTALIIVTVLVLRGAIERLRHPTHVDASDPPPAGSPSLRLMMAFSAANLLLDFVNVACFARGEGMDNVVTGYAKAASTTDLNASAAAASAPSSSKFFELTTGGGHGASYGSVSLTGASATDVNPSMVADDLMRDSDDEGDEEGDCSGILDDGDSDADSDDDEGGEGNLNMCSAYTHVCADTLRSVAVLIAAGIAAIAPVGWKITPEAADAWAAVVVSVLIGASLVPLVGGLHVTFAELRSLDRKRKMIGGHGQR